MFAKTMSDSAIVMPIAEETIQKHPVTFANGIDTIERWTADTLQLFSGVTS
jgi:hypothetical protein